MLFPDFWGQGLSYGFLLFYICWHKDIKLWTAYIIFPDKYWNEK